jgi:hypothetical protein
MPIMELFSNLSDDQIALLGCAAALVTTGSIMCLSYFIGRGRTQSSQPVTRVPMPAIVDAAEISEKRNAA